jgi:hypothetical protein
VDFFEPPPPREEPARGRRPVWLGAPDNELGISVPLRVPLVRTDTLAILVDQVVAYSTGFSFGLSARSHPDRRLSDRGFADLFHPRVDGMDRLLIGIQFADGRKATNLEHRHPTSSDDLGPVLMGGGGGGGGGRFDFSFWVWPLPPEGPLTFVCRWDGEGVELTSVDVDAAAIRAASAQSEQLWPEQGDGSGGWTSGSQLS